MKIAIFHNYMDNIGGAEFVDLTLARELGADIYTSNIDKEKIEKMGFKTDNIFSIGKIPTNAPFRQEAAYWLFRNLKLKNKYDFYIIGGDWAMSGALHNKPNLWYVYSPKRELWDLHTYVRKEMVSSGFLGSVKKYIFDVWVFIRRIIDRMDVKNVQKIACISGVVQDRVKKYLNRDSIVIYPPTETKKYYYKESKGYWLSVNRLLNHKRIDVQLKAFEKLKNEKLIIVGCYEKSHHFKNYAKFVMQTKPSNVEVRSWVSDEELIQLYANCKGVLATAKEEDYGMSPVEAMASGKPVIAANEGGYKETVLSGKTGILIDDIDENKLAKAIEKLGKEIDQDPLKFKTACQEQAAKFDTKIFVENFKKIISVL